MKNNEIWLPVVGYEGHYEVSDLGRICSMDKVDSRGQKRKGKIMNPIKSGNSYLEVKLCRGGGDTKRLTIHRIVAIAFIVNPENKPCVNHKDGDRHNNSVENLEWCTHRENTAHGINHGRISIRGEQNGYSKLKEADVRHIRVCNLPAKVLAKKYGVASGHINSVRTKKTWKHLE